MVDRLLFVFADDYPVDGSPVWRLVLDLDTVSRLPDDEMDFRDSDENFARLLKPDGYFHITLL